MGEAKEEHMLDTCANETVWEIVKFIVFTNTCVDKYNIIIYQKQTLLELTERILVRAEGKLKNESL